MSEFCEDVNKKLFPLILFCNTFYSFYALVHLSTLIITRFCLISTFVLHLYIVCNISKLTTVYITVAPKPLQPFIAQERLAFENRFCTISRSLYCIYCFYIIASPMYMFIYLFIFYYYHYFFISRCTILKYMVVYPLYNFCISFALFQKHCIVFVIRFYITSISLNCLYI